MRTLSSPILFHLQKKHWLKTNCFDAAVKSWSCAAFWQSELLTFISGSVWGQGENTLCSLLSKPSLTVFLSLSLSLSLPPRLSITCPKGHKKDSESFSTHFHRATDFSFMSQKQHTWRPIVFCIGHFFPTLFNMTHRTFVITATISQGCGMIMEGPDMRATDQLLMLSIKSTDCQQKSTSRVESVLFRMRLILLTITVTLQLHRTNSWHLLGMSQKEWWEEKIAFGLRKKKETADLDLAFTDKHEPLVFLFVKAAALPTRNNLGITISHSSSGVPFTVPSDR